MDVTGASAAFAEVDGVLTSWSQYSRGRVHVRQTKFSGAYDGTMIRCLNTFGRLCATTSSKDLVFRPPSSGLGTSHVIVARLTGCVQPLAPVTGPPPQPPGGPPEAALSATLVPGHHRSSAPSDAESRR